MYEITYLINEENDETVWISEPTETTEPDNGGGSAGGGASADPGGESPANTENETEEEQTEETSETVETEETEETAAEELTDYQSQVLESLDDIRTTSFALCVILSATLLYQILRSLFKVS